MADFNFSPEFNADVSNELDRRKGLIENKNSEWNYRKYAYFTLESIKSTTDLTDSDSDYLSIFSLRPQGGFSIGTSSPDGYLKAFHSDENDIRKLKPILSSATISSNGGGDIYDAYISEVNVSFKVYTLDDLSIVERELFSLGAKVKVTYGWLGENNPGILNGELIVNIYNFGFTMSSDGSFDCSIKGLTEGVFVGSQTIADTISLTESEKEALGENTANPATLPQSLLAKALESIGVKGGDTNARSWLDWLGSDAGINSLDKGGDIISETKNDYTYYFALWNEIVADEIKPITIPYISFGELIKYINEQTKSSQFEFITKDELFKIATPKNTSGFGSADPRKFIFPGDMSIYNDSNYTPSKPPRNTVPSDYHIQNILISIYLIIEYYDSLSKKTKNEKVIPPSMVDLIKKISSDVSRLSGGLVDIKTVPKQENDNVEFENTFQIFNNTQVQKVEVPKGPYEFSILNKNSIVKDISIDTDFDVDTMTMMSIGRVKKGEFNITPLKTSIYTDLPDIPINQSERDADIKEAGDTISKTSVAEKGIDDSKVSSISDSMRKALVADVDNGTFISLPFYIKLGITIDGINGLGFLQPISVDRLPQNYKNANVKFLITSIEHTFDGQGGWETKLDTAMKVGL